MSRNSTAGHVPLELALWRGECAYVFPPTFTTSSPAKVIPKSTFRELAAFRTSL
jgi:hypothetical protein